MFKLIIFNSCLCSFILTVVADAMIGPGKWYMINIEIKKGDFDKFEFDITQRKYNRTHDIFQGVLTFREEMDEKYGVIVEVCKHVDGGCKQYQVLTDDSFINFIIKYAESNFIELLKHAGVENPEFPVPKGEYKIAEYLWNWDSMPEEGPWGRYTAECCVLEGTARCGCIIVEVSFEKTDEEDDDEE